MGLLDGLEGEARTERAELIAWLLDRGFSIDQIRASVAPLLLPANRVMGEDGVYLSAREICEETGLDLPLLQRLQGAVGLPRIEDPDAAVLRGTGVPSGPVQNEKKASRPRLSSSLPCTRSQL